MKLIKIGEVYFPRLWEGKYTGLRDTAITLAWDLAMDYLSPMESFALTRIRIQNLACFGDLELHLASSTLLLGRNGVGKSTLFEILFSLNEWVNGGHGTEPAMPTYQRSPGPALIELDVCSNQRKLSYSLVLSHPPELTQGPTAPHWLITKECLKEGDHVLCNFENGIFSYDDKEMALVQDRSPLSTVKFPENSIILKFKAWLGGVWLLRLEPGQMLASTAEAHDALTISGDNFVSWLLNFRRRRKIISEIVESVRGAIDGLSNLSFVRAGREYVLVAQLGSINIDFDALSDGQRCLIVLHAVPIIARHMCTLLLLDEPDAHITSEEILPFLTTLRQNTELFAVQLMVASHHPHVIDLLTPETSWELIQQPEGVTAQVFKIDRASGLSASRFLLLRGRP